ncbi:uncharacterized protein LOC124278705 [Haliotis rubra]|uniref:uncharacterized protein LOC124278705 n=1 Tax=Haliotis rubra TaxID=36100 RepID=UPI001EE50840|nr:uncharacterized protein LOC124278705 [Haliotis rubra]
MAGCLPQQQKKSAVDAESMSGIDNMNTRTQDVVDKIFGEYTSDLWEVFKRYDLGENKLPISILRRAFCELNLYPSYSQVLEMVHCAVEYGSPCVPDHITFGEFCVLVDELQYHYERGIALPQPRSMLKNKPDAYEIRRKRKESLQANFQVFLGGSCSGTTWRQEKAIPYLKLQSLTFYNPVVNNWRPELIELEDRAKQAAQLLFFMIDNHTRAVVSMVEVAYLVGSRRQVVLVYNDSWEKVILNGECPSSRELGDIVRARTVLIDIVERNAIPVFTNIHKALQCTATGLKQNMRVQDLEINHGAQPVKFGHTQVGSALLKLRETFNSISSNIGGKMTKEDVKLGYKCYSGLELDMKWLNQQRPVQDSFSFEEFCCIVTEMKRKKPPLLTSVLTRMLSPVFWVLNRYRPEVYDEVTEEVRDVYLGGSCGESKWREEIAVPMLKRHGLSYQDPHVSEWVARLIPMQVALRERCRLLLYVFTQNTRGLAAMVEAGYYIGLGCRVVLCIQMMKDATVIAGEELTESALNDYNRGRMYLSDMASREGVPVFDNIQDSVQCVISQLQSAT